MMKKTWQMIAVSVLNGEMNFMNINYPPNDERRRVDMDPRPMSRKEAISQVAAWNRENEWWTYILLEDESYTPKMFDVKKQNPWASRP